MRELFFRPHGSAELNEKFIAFVLPNSVDFLDPILRVLRVLRVQNQKECIRVIRAIREIRVVCWFCFWFGRVPNAECRSSLIPQRLHRFHARGAIRRNDAGQQSYAEKADGHCNKRE